MHREYNTSCTTSAMPLWNGMVMMWPTISQILSTPGISSNKRWSVALAVQLHNPSSKPKTYHFKADQTLEDYYRAKVRLLNQTTLSEHEKVQMLTAGLPHSWKVSLAPIPITTTDVWFESAQRVEAVHSKPVFQKDFKPQSPH